MKFPIIYRQKSFLGFFIYPLLLVSTFLSVAFFIGGLKIILSGTEIWAGLLFLLAGTLIFLFFIPFILKQNREGKIIIEKERVSFKGKAPFHASWEEPFSSFQGIYYGQITEKVNGRVKRNYYVVQLIHKSDKFRNIIFHELDAEGADVNNVMIKFAQLLNLPVLEPDHDGTFFQRDPLPQEMKSEIRNTASGISSQPFPKGELKYSEHDKGFAISAGAVYPLIGGALMFTALLIVIFFIVYLQERYTNYLVFLPVVPYYIWLLGRPEHVVSFNSEGIKSFYRCYGREVKEEGIMMQLRIFEMFGLVNKQIPVKEIREVKFNNSSTGIVIISEKAMIRVGFKGSRAQLNWLLDKIQRFVRKAQGSI